MLDAHAALSSYPVVADLFSAEKLPSSDRVVYERGPVALADSSQGVDYQLWRGRLVGDTVYLTSPTTPETPVFTVRGIRQISLGFDQNGRPLVAYMIDDVLWMYWYSTVEQQFIHSAFESGVRDVRVLLPDRRKFQLESSEVGVYYTQADRLVWRRQLDRYTIPYVLLEGIGGRLMKVGMNAHYRLQFIFQAQPYGTYSCTHELACL